MNNRIKNNNSRKRAAKRERIIMIVSSAFVMATLTLTGIYMKEKSEKEKDDGYSIDFAQMEDNVSDKYAELAEGIQNTTPIVDLTPEVAQLPLEEIVKPDEELDYMPREDSLIGDSSITTVGSGQVQNPGIENAANTDIIEEELPTVVSRELSFSEEVGLVKPVQGDILMHYSMDSLVYFNTLDQYKNNPAVIFKILEGSQVFACAAGQVVKIYMDEEIGATVVLDLGNGYQATYGQLATYSVGIGDYVEANQCFATVGLPTKYYITEGSNLYFALEKDGEPVNPENYFLQ